MTKSSELADDLFNGQASSPYNNGEDGVDNGDRPNSDCIL